MNAPTGMVARIATSLSMTAGLALAARFPAGRALSASLQIDLTLPLWPVPMLHRCAKREGTDAPEALVDHLRGDRGAIADRRAGSGRHGAPVHLGHRDKLELGGIRRPQERRALQARHRVVERAGRDVHRRPRDLL